MHTFLMYERLNVVYVAYICLSCSYMQPWPEQPMLTDVVSQQPPMMPSGAAWGAGLTVDILRCEDYLKLLD